jgi:hypothetical protein
MVLDASSCIKLFSGLSTYNATNPGLFVSSCIVPAINNKPLTLICYPNPASTTVWVKTAQPVAETSSSVSLLLIGSDGKIVGAYTTSVAQLSTGFAIDLTSKAAGVYFIRHTSNAQTGELKIIKVHFVSETQRFIPNIVSCRKFCRKYIALMYLIYKNLKNFHMPLINQ